MLIGCAFPLFPPNRNILSLLPSSPHKPMWKAAPALLTRFLLLSLLLLGLSLCSPRAAYANPTVMQGSSATFPATGTHTPQAMWDIVLGSMTIATSSTTNNWMVTFNTGTNNFTVTAPGSANIAANYEVRTYSSAGVKSAFFDVVAGVPPALSALTLSPTTVLSGNPATGTVTLTASAPTNGILVTLTSSDPAATVPGSVTVPSGQSSATFTVNTQGVTANKTVTLTANYNSVAKTATLTITPAPSVTALSLAPAGVTGGSSSNGRVTISAVATANVVVNLSSANAAASVPATVTVPTGQTQANFTVTTTPVATQTTGNISASFNSTSQSAVLNVYPPQLLDTGLTLSPSTIPGGQNVTGTLTLNGPAPSGGITVSINASKPQYVGMGGAYVTYPITLLPVNVTISANQTSTNFPLATAWVDYAQTVNVTATLGQQVVAAPLTLTAANLHVTDLPQPGVIRLRWDGATTTSTFTLVRGEVAIGTFPATTFTFDDNVGVTNGTAYLYRLYDTSNMPYNTQTNTYTPGYQISAEKVAAYWIAASANQSVDSRLDLRYSTNVFLDHCFGATTYRGGLFAGYAPDPSKVGRSFARTLIAAPSGSGYFFRVGGMYAYCTGLATHSLQTVAIGCQAIADAGWNYSTLVWSQTNPTGLNPGAATSVTPITYDPAHPQAQWVSWSLSDSLWNAVQQASTNMTPTSFVAAWAAPDETQTGWAYFAKAEYGASTAPYAGYALSYPVPVAFYVTRIYSAGGFDDYYNIILNGLNPGGSATVTVNVIAGTPTTVTADGLHHVFGPYHHQIVDGVPEDNLTWGSVQCNGVLVMRKVASGGGGTGGGGGTVFGGG